MDVVSRVQATTLSPQATLIAFTSWPGSPISSVYASDSSKPVVNVPKSASAEKLSLFGLAEVPDITRRDGRASNWSPLGAEG